MTHWFTNLVGWHAGAVSFPQSDVMFAQLACPLSDVMFCLHYIRTNQSQCGDSPSTDISSTDNSSTDNSSTDNTSTFLLPEASLGLA